SLVQLGTASDAALDALVLLLKDDDSYMRYGAAASLGQLGISSDAVIGALVSLLKEDDDSNVRCSAAASLVQLGTASDVLLNSLLTLLKDGYLSFSLSGRVSDRASQSLITLSKKSDTVKPAIVEWIEQNQDEDYVGKGIDVLWETSGGQSATATLA
ncbi:MAG: HEAT repeat domain-containing protein, partial [Phormidesmis sp.]